MSWRTHRFVLMLRNAGRVVGLNKRIASLLLGERYEDRFGKQFSACIRPGDCVWDIGANIGYYTRLFVERAGQEGKVFAFEPSPVNYCRLVEKCKGLENVTLLQCGLGKSDDKLHFHQGEDALGATSRVTHNNSGGVVVDIRSGDSLLADGSIISAPMVIKIDVEGYEWEVLQGMKELLKHPFLRTIGIEVHFGILQKRCMVQVPQQIEQLLRDSGFLLSWPDRSHVLAVRKI